MHKSVFNASAVSPELLEAAKSLNLTSFIQEGQFVSVDLVAELRSALPNVDIYSSLTCFDGADLLQIFPDAKPVEASNKSTLNAVCPTHEGVRKEILNRADKLIKSNIDGLWLNHARYPTEWELPEPNILDTCYCDRCLQKFSEYIGEQITGTNLEEKVLLIDGSYYIEWIEFKGKQITSLVESIRELITLSGRSVKLGFFALPWEDKEYGAAIKRIVAQDFASLIPVIDILSPGLYHAWCEQPVDWIKNKVNYFWETGKTQLPIIQSVGDFSADEFKAAIENATVSPSIGFIVYNLEDLTKQKEKLDIVKSFGSAM